MTPNYTHHKAHADADHHNGESVTSPVQILILALFFQLLVFFILMNSISEFSKKADRVMDSMRTTFGQQETEIAIQKISINPTGQNGSGKGTSLADIAGQFEHEVPGLTPAQVRKTGVLELTLPASYLNKSLGVSFTSRIDPALARMMTFAAAHENPSYQVTLFKNIRPEVFSATGALDAGGIASLIVWQQKLIEIGLPPSHLTYGVRAGRAGTVTLRIEPIEVEDMGRAPDTKANQGGL